VIDCGPRSLQDETFSKGLYSAFRDTQEMLWSVLNDAFSTVINTIVENIVEKINNAYTFKNTFKNVFYPNLVYIR